MNAAWVRMTLGLKTKIVVSPFAPLLPCSCKRLECSVTVYDARIIAE
jgi:hypothetical protein